MRHLLVGLSLGMAACAPAGGVRVAWVDGARLIRESRSGKAIRDRVTAEGERLTRALQALKAAVAAKRRTVAALGKRRPATDPARRKAEAELQAATLRLRRTHAQYREQLNAYGRRLLHQFTARIRRIAQGLREARGFDLVVMTSRGEDQGLWLWPATDITEAVRTRLDREQREERHRPTP